MSGLVQKLTSWVTGHTMDDDYLFDDEQGYVEEAPRRMPAGNPAPRGYDNTMASTYDDEQALQASSSKRSMKVLPHPSAQTTYVVVVEPRAFEESIEIIDHLKGRKAVILNMHLLDTAQSQRVVDFLSGATSALEGHQQKIGSGVFLFTPNSMHIATQGGVDQPLSLADAYWNTPR
jgi:cell division inhibitor SepF